MRRSLHAWSIAFISASTACTAHPPSLPAINDFSGKWRVTQIAGYDDTSGGAPLGRRLMGHTLSITADGMGLDLDHWACSAHSSYTVRVVRTADPSDEAGVPTEDVGLPATAPLLDSQNCLQIYWLSNDLIEFDFNGVFVRARRMH